MRIELLVFEGCPHWESARSLLQEAMAALGITGEIKETLVDSYELAEALRFPGSPTLRVDGEDVAPLPEAYEPALACRTYTVEGRRQGLPDKAWVLAALRKAQEAEGSGCCAPTRTIPLHQADSRSSGGRFERRTMFSAVLLSVVASTCCWLPLALAGLGLGVATGTLGVKIALIRPWALGALAMLLAGVIGWWVLKRYGRPVEGNACCSDAPRFPALPVAILGLSFLGAAAAPRLLRAGRSTTFASTAPAPVGGTLLVLSTPQFDCPSCAGALPQTLAKAPGVASVQMDFDKRETRIAFKPGAEVDGTLARWKTELGFEGREVTREATK